MSYAKRFVWTQIWERLFKIFPAAVKKHQQPPVNSIQPEMGRSSERAHASMTHRELAMKFTWWASNVVCIRHSLSILKISAFSSRYKYLDRTNDFILPTSKFPECRSWIMNDLNVGGTTIRSSKHSKQSGITERFPGDLRKLEIVVFHY